MNNQLVTKIVHSQNTLRYFMEFVPPNMGQRPQDNWVIPPYVGMSCI